MFSYIISSFMFCFVQVLTSKLSNNNSPIIPLPNHSTAQNQQNQRTAQNDIWPQMPLLLYVRKDMFLYLMHRVRCFVCNAKGASTAVRVTIILLRRRRRPTSLTYSSDRTRVRQSNRCWTIDNKTHGRVMESDGGGGCGSTKKSRHPADPRGLGARQSERLLQFCDGG